MLKVACIGHSEKLDFVYSKPSIEEDGTVVVHRFEDRDGVLSTCGSSRQLTPAVWLKMKSRAAVRHWRGALPAPRFAAAVLTAAQLNERTMRRVVAALPPALRRRHLATGRQLRFAADRVIASGPDWIEAPLELAVPPEQDDEAVPPEMAGGGANRVLALARALDNARRPAVFRRHALHEAAHADAGPRVGALRRVA